MLSPDARAGKERIFSTAVRPKIGKKVTLDENSNSGPPTLVLTTIWDCPGITLDEIVDDSNSKIIKGWRCGYCPIPGGLGAAPFFKYRNATKALSHLSSMGKDIVSCKGLRDIPFNVCNTLTTLRFDKVNKKLIVPSKRIS